MTQPKPSLRSALVASIEDSVALFRQMPMVVIATIAAFASLRAIDAAVQAKIAATSLFMTLWTVPFLALCAAIATPITVLLSRHIVLWERLMWTAARERTQLFIDTFFANWLISFVALAPAAILAPLLPQESAELTLIEGGLIFAVIAALVIWGSLASVRFLTYPASVAVGEASASLGSSWTASRGWTLRTVGVLLPALACLIALEAFWWDVGNPPPHPSPIYAVSMGVVDTLSAAIFSALAAQVYLWSRPSLRAEAAR